MNTIYIKINFSSSFSCFNISSKEIVLGSMDARRVCNIVSVSTPLFILYCFMVLGHNNRLPLNSLFFGFNESNFTIFGGGNIPNTQYSRSESLGFTPAITENDNNLALCIVGGLRSFELTAPTILRHLIEFYHPLATFFNIPLDENTHKISLLSNSSLPIAINIVSQKPMHESDFAKAVLSPSGSPNGLQGLLQYFELVEGCADQITAYQKKYNVKFDRILRTRVDTFWTADPPSLSTFDLDSFITPYGSQFGGLNDRFAISNYSAGMPGLKRLTLLKKVSLTRVSGLNSERTLKSQIELLSLKQGRANLPFCVLSKRQYSWPPNSNGVPVLSISSTGAMNGGKCRPCLPAASGKDAEAILDSLAQNWGGIGVGKGVNLCDGSKEWDSNWEMIYDKAVGEEEAHARHHIQSRNYQTCLEENTVLVKRMKVYSGPPASILCILNVWGNIKSAQNHEPGEQLWHHLPGGLSSSSTAYVFGISKDFPSEKIMLNRYGCSIYAFDCIPFVFKWDDPNMKNESKFRAYDICLGNQDEARIFQAMESRSNSLTAYFNDKEDSKAYDFVGKPLHLQMRSLDSILKQMGHETVDLVRVNMGEALINICLSDWSKRKVPLPVCQLSVKFDLHRRKNGREEMNECFQVLQELGLYLTKCYGVFGSEVCHFLSSIHCTIQ